MVMLSKFIESAYEDNTGNMWSEDQLLNLVEDWKDPNPKPIIMNYEGIDVVRDDLLNHGSKIRFVDKLIRETSAKEIVFGCCPATGTHKYLYQQLHRNTTKKLYCLWQNEPENYHEYQKRGMDLGAIYEWVNMGMLSVTKSRAKKYVAEDPENRMEFPIGLEHPTIVASIIKVARNALSENPPSEIWSVGSSGTISRGLQLAFPDIPVNVVSVGHKMNEREIGRAKYYRSEYQFDKAIKEHEMPPFPSAPTYDAKAWKFVKEYAKPLRCFGT